MASHLHFIIQQKIISFTILECVMLKVKLLKIYLILLKKFQTNKEMSFLITTSLNNFVLTNSLTSDMFISKTPTNWIHRHEKPQAEIWSAYIMLKDSDSASAVIVSEVRSKGVKPSQDIAKGIHQTLILKGQLILDRNASWGMRSQS